MIVELEQCKERLCGHSEKLESLKTAIDTKEIRLELGELKAKSQNEEFWADIKTAQTVLSKIKVIENKLNKVASLSEKINNLNEIVSLCIEEDSTEMLDEVAKVEKEVVLVLQSLWVQTLLKNKYDECNAILSLHAGAGGTEAQDWVQMLYRMYQMYCEKHDFKVQEIDKLNGDEAGIKSVTFLVEGSNAYGYLHAEKGVHRLVRISPFDASSRRHTSFASLEVMPQIDNTDNEIKIKPEELRVDTYRSSGAGGQHVNKTESAIRITHLPSGIVVQCQNQRSQIQNREMAMNVLTSKLIERREFEQLQKAQEIKGEIKKIEWGSQIRSYVFCPYTLVKDHRTGFENTNVEGVMNGDIEGFIVDYLKKS